MESKGDRLEDEDVEEKEDAVGQDWPGHGPLGWGCVWVTLGVKEKGNKQHCHVLDPVKTVLPGKPISISDWKEKSQKSPVEKTQVGSEDCQ